MNFLLLASFSETMGLIGYILLALLVLMVMITVHELGHYIAGKIFKFKINEFAIGFGPKIFKKTLKSGEVFSVRALPIGGFCAFSGEDEDSDDPSSFNNKKPWQRIIVLVSGALMNYLLAVLIIITMFNVYGQPALLTYKMDNNTEYLTEYSFQEKDVILSVEGKNVYMFTDLMSALDNKNQGEIIRAKVKRKGVVQDIFVQLRTHTYFQNVEDLPRLYSALGIKYDINDTGQLVNGGLYNTDVKIGFFETIGKSFEYSFKLAGTVFKVLGQLITGVLGINSVGGTVTTVSITAKAIRVGGLRNLLNIASLIGVNLAVFNLLPFPALDGSRVVFTTIEWIRKKPINRRVEGLIHTIGLVFLLLFTIMVDLMHCF